MAKLKLTYFDFDGGRGEPARIALHSAGIEFQDDRVTFPQWKERKADTPYGAMPLLEVDGETVAQSNGINRYVGKLAGLYPEDPWQAALCDEVMDAVEEVGEKVVGTFSITDEDDKKAAREKLTSGPLTFYVKALAARLEQRGGQWFADGRFTMADLRVFLWVRTLRKGVLDYVPSDLADRLAPTLVEHADRVAAHPAVVAYYESRKA
jgi:glutathione S-transferase